MSTEDKNAKTTEATESTKTKIDPADIIDQDTFDQVKGMDEEDDDSFSRGVVWNYFEQVESTFKEMDKSIEEKALKKLSEFGHFLKGSSAALGLKKMQASCAKIELYGLLKNDDGVSDSLKPDEALKMIEDKLKQLKKDYKETETYMRSLYEDSKVVNQSI